MISALTADAIVEKAHTGPPLVVRKAAMRDIAPLLKIINGYASKGIMLPRTEFEMSENIRDFSVIQAGDELAGCAALHFYSPTSAEIRSVAVAENWKTHGAGRKLVDALVTEAQQYQLAMVFAFTYVPDFFRKLNFEEVERGALPLKAWKDCLRCPKFQCCDEVPMIRLLRSPNGGSPGTPSWGDWRGPSTPNSFILLPTVKR